MTSETENKNKFHEKISINKGKHLHFVRRAHWEFVERANVELAVVIAALTIKREVLFVEQFRPPVMSQVIELPAGLVGDLQDSKNELPLDAARRELLEETGYAGGKWTEACEGPPSPGMNSEWIKIFTAIDVDRFADGGGDESEEIIIHRVPMGEVDLWLSSMAKMGKSVDPKVYSGLWFLNKNG